MSKAANMFAVSQTAGRLARGYYSFLVAHSVAVNPKSINSLPPAKSPSNHPVGEIKRKDGTAHVLDMRHYLDVLREDRGLQEEFLRTWAIGALLTLGDELKKFAYFDRAPILEMVYHLRNSVAHGNRFTIDADGQKRLKKFPAHNRNAEVKSPAGAVYEIINSTSGSLLFDFMGPADLIDLLQSVEVHLSQAAAALAPERKSS
jgi:hypothetical protein